MSELLSLAKNELPYFQRSTISENMKEKIKNIFREITIQEIEKVKASFSRRLQACLVNMILNIYGNNKKIVF